MKYIELSACFGQNAEVARRNFCSGTSATPAVFNRLVERRVFGIPAGNRQAECGRCLDNPPFKSFEQSISSGHTTALWKVSGQNVCFAAWVTSSGKTGDLHPSDKVIRQGEAGAVSVAGNSPDHTDYRKAATGVRFASGIYHSKFPDAERVEIWRNSFPDMDMTSFWGVRSSVFLPFRKLGLVIVGRGARNTYKQQDPAPATMHVMPPLCWLRCMAPRLLLGTATPFHRKPGTTPCPESTGWWS